VPVFRPDPNRNLKEHNDMSSPETEKLAAALDDVLTDPESLRAIYAYMNHPAVKALIDTPERRQQLATTESTVAAMGDAYGGASPTEVPMWIRLGLLSATTAWVADTTRTCMHCPRPDGPVPGWAAAWKPSLVVCPQCLHMLATGGGVEEYRCDGCGRISMPEDGGVRVASLSTGALTYRFGACPDCWTDFEAVAQSIGA
jgi:hypothetical protein